VETSAYLAPDRKHNVSIPRTSRQSKSSRLALAATGAAAAVAVLVSGGAAAAAGAPAASYRLAAVQGSAAVSRIQPAGGPHPSQPAAQAAAGGQDALAGQATAAGRKAAAGRTPAGRTPAGQHRPATHRKPAGRLRLSFGDRLAGPPRGTASRRPGQHTTAAHRGHAAAAHARSAPARPTRACADSTLHWWICHAERVLEQHGTPHSRLSTNAAYIVVKHESGGNPHAYNGWDINAAQGHPSEGIAQVIGPTFHAYKLHGYGDVWNPVDNMVAAFRYAISRYGSMNKIPGVVAVRQGGSYIGY
jgi:Transglycosylase SLT domain